MKTYRLLFMDLDETLLDFKRAERTALESTFTACGLPFTADAEAVFHRKNKTLWQALEKGEVTQQELRTERFRQLFEALDWNGDHKAVSERYIGELASCSFPLPGAAETCAYLASKYRLVLVTNGIADVQYPRIAASPFAGVFEAVIISEEAGVSKPDPAIFEYACEKVGFYDKPSMLMIGDSLESDIRGAENFGIDGCHLNRAGAPAPAGSPVPACEIKELKELTRIL